MPAGVADLTRNLGKICTKLNKSVMFENHLIHFFISQNVSENDLQNYVPFGGNLTHFCTKSDILVEEKIPKKVKLLNLTSNSRVDVFT